MPTVLCVDDNEDILFGYERILPDNGYVPVTARNGREALSALSTHSIDAILMDKQLGKEDGLDVIREIRSMRVTIPIALCTDVLYTKDRKEEAKSAGANEYVGKEDFLKFLQKYCPISK